MSEPGSSPQALAEQAAYHLLKHRLRSAAELRRRLLEKGHREPVVDELIERLTASGFLDDRRFAVALVRDGIGLHQRGSRRLAADLQQFGVDPDLAEEVLAEENDPADELDRAVALARHRATGLGDLEPAAAWRRLSGHLARRGYPPAVVRRAVEIALEQAEE